MQLNTLSILGWVVSKAQKTTISIVTAREYFFCSGRTVHKEPRHVIIQHHISVFVNRRQRAWCGHVRLSRSSCVHCVAPAHACDGNTTRSYDHLPITWTCRLQRGGQARRVHCASCSPHRPSGGCTTTVRKCRAHMRRDHAVNIHRASRLSHRTSGSQHNAGTSSSESEDFHFSDVD